MKPVVLTEDSIKGYGCLLNESMEDPKFENEQFRFIGDVYKFETKRELSVGILTSKKRDIKLECLERHLNTIEILIQLENDAVIFLAKSSEKDEKVKEIKAFHFKQGQAIALDKATWHWAPYPFNKIDCKTLVIFKEGTSENDCEIEKLNEKITLSF